MSESLRAILLALLQQYLLALPFYVLDIVVIVRALQVRSVHPRSAWLAVIGYSGVLLLSIVSVPINLFVMHSISSLATRATWLSMIGIVQSFINFLSTALIVAALFVAWKTTPLVQQVPHSPRATNAEVPD